MASVDLNSMELSELKKLQKDVTKAIDDFEERKRLEALAAVKAKAQEMGFSLAELTGDVTKKKAGKSAGIPKYVHPENPAKTWTGRGRQPAWIKEALDAGRSLDEFLITKS
ncbi:H-NS histone family protein [Roseivivax sp. GX 12232]|uniref:H-NS histone family protein n=1 Tax=Roseivivax sp. GX 12232 TaxID=2900547 RepID=UPI001E4627B4|nr:H-NS histone family protein [Roseivivax sp. GX 12232]MCE0507367.1 H-NS histone family protein [Roseivivax sp. GX 12232]